MSALNSDSGGTLSTLVSVQRGMTPSEIEDFLATGIMPDLSKPPSEKIDPDNLQTLSETDARLWLGMITASGDGATVPTVDKFKLCDQCFTLINHILSRDDYFAGNVAALLDSIATTNSEFGNLEQTGTKNGMSESSERPDLEVPVGELSAEMEPS